MKPNVILMDLVMPKMGGIEAIADIICDEHDACMLVITSFSEKVKAISVI